MIGRAAPGLPGGEVGPGSAVGQAAAGGPIEAVNTRVNAFAQGQAERDQGRPRRQAMPMMLIFKACLPGSSPVQTRNTTLPKASAAESG